MAALLTMYIYIHIHMHWPRIRTIYTLPIMHSSCSGAEGYPVCIDSWMIIAHSHWLIHIVNMYKHDIYIYIYLFI